MQELSNSQRINRQRIVWQMATIHLLGLTLLVAGFGLWRGDWFKSALVGGLVGFLPNLYFTYYAFRYSGARNMPWIVRSMHWGQSGKVMLTMVGFALAFRFIKPLYLAVFFGVYALMVVIQIGFARYTANQLSSQL